MVCPDDNTLTKFLEGTLEPSQRNVIEDHIDQCVRCRKSIAVFVQSAELHNIPVKNAFATIDEKIESYRDTPLIQGLSAGTMVDHFQVIRLIGRGGMGEVYLGQDTRLDRKIALKILRPAKLESAEGIERFLSEARITARFNHPHIVAIYHVGEFEGWPYLALEYLEGQSLRQILTIKRPPQREAIQMGIDIAEALSEAHKHGVLHRDLKPENVFLPKDNRLRVVDFGLAKRIPSIDYCELFFNSANAPLEPSIHTNLTGKELNGTPAYMAPEQWRREETTCAAADIWSLGVILHELLSGHRPYEFRSIRELNDFMISTPPVNMTVKSEYISGELADIIQSCLNWKSAERPKALEVVQRLTHYLKQEDYKKCPTRTDSLTIPQQSPIEQSTWLKLFIFRLRSNQFQRRVFVGISLLVCIIIVGVVYRAHRISIQKDRAEHEQAEALRQGAEISFAQGALFEAKAKLRRAVEIEDSLLGRTLWWQIKQEPLLWQKKLNVCVHDLSISTDGRFLALAGVDKTVRIINLLDRTEIKKLRHEDQVSTVAFSPNGAQLASGTLNGELKLWSMKDGRARPFPTHNTAIQHVIFNSSGKLLAAGAGDGTVRVWDITTGRIIFERKVSEERIHTLSFNSDSRYLIIGTENSTLGLWPLARVGTPYTWKGHSDALSSMAFSPSGHLLASAGSDHTVKLWKISASIPPQLLVTIPATVRQLSFSSDGELLALGRTDGTIDFRQTPAPLIKTNQFKAPPSAKLFLFFVPQSHHLVTISGDNALLFWDADHQSPMDRDLLPSAASSIAFSPDGTLIASGHWDHTIRIRNARFGTLVNIFKAHRGPINDLHFSADGRFIGSISDDATLELWNVASGEQQTVLSGHKGPVHTLDFHPREARVATGSSDKTIRIWDLASSKTIALLLGHTSDVLSVAYSPDGLRLASGSKDKSVRIWDASSGHLIKTLRSHNGAIFGIAFSLDGKSLFSTSGDGTLRVWDLSSGASHILTKTVNSRIYRMGIDPNGKIIGLPLSNGTAQLYDLQDNRTIVLDQRQAEVNEVEFSPDGQIVAAACDDGIVRLWHTRTGKPAWFADGFIPSTKEVFAENGWIRLDQSFSKNNSEKEGMPQLKKDIEARGKYVSSSSRHTLCVQTHDDQLELWNTKSDQRLWQKRITHLKKIVALPTGCLSLANGKAILHPVEGLVKPLADNVTAIASNEKEIWIATANKIYAFNDSGQSLFSFSIPKPGVTAILPFDHKLLLGYFDGHLEEVSFELHNVFSFKHLSTIAPFPVAELFLGPMNTIILAYTNGLVALYNEKNDQILLQFPLHGGAKYVFQSKDWLYLISELGEIRKVDIRPFKLSYCDLMRELWKYIPVTWKEGDVMYQKIPSCHRCINYH